MMKKGVLFTGGEGPCKKYVDTCVGTADIIAAADSGMDLAYSLGIIPDYLIGDMDSLINHSLIRKLPEERVFTADTEKDETDTELGLDLLFSKKCDEITIIGGGGGRIDHFLGILSLFHREAHPHKWLMRDYMIHCISRKTRIYGRIGCKVSFFPVGRTEATMTSQGLKWNLNSLIWEIGDAGISNVIAESPCVVVPKTGRLILVSELAEELKVE